VVYVCDRSFNLINPVQDRPKEPLMVLVLLLVLLLAPIFVYSAVDVGQIDPVIVSSFSFI
jgi:hypothetical protein